MGVLNFLTGTAGYTAILAAFGLAVAAHFFAPRAWSALAWTIAFGVLGAAFVGQREITSAAQIKAEQAEAREQKLIGDVATARADGLAAVNLMAAARQQAVGELDSHFQKELSHAKSENARIRTAARAGAVVVRIPGASCPVGPGAVSSTASAGRMGDAAVQVDAQLREAVFDHREALIEAEKKIGYLQGYIRKITEPVPALGLKAPVQ